MPIQPLSFSRVPQWSTSSRSQADDALLREHSALGEHLQMCTCWHSTWAAWFARMGRCQALLSAHAVTVVVLVALLALVARVVC